MIKEDIDNVIQKTRNERSTDVSIVNFDGEIPDEVYNFNWVTKLYFYGCPKVKLSSVIEMKNLMELHIRLCNIESFHGCNKLDKLHELNLEGNNLIKIPGDLPSSITSLDISDNKLVSLDNIENLNQLIELYAINNKINILPDFDFNPSLELLELGNNNITDFPKSLVKRQFERLKNRNLDVHIYNNPFIRNLKLNTEEYVLRADWGYVKRLSNSEYLIKDYIQLYGYKE